MNPAASRRLDAAELADLHRLLDRQSILDCLSRASRGTDRFDRELFLMAFHSDAVIDAGALVAGPPEVYDKASELHAHGQSCTLHNLLNHNCEIDGDVAHCETYFLYVGHNRDESNWLAGGRYIDRMERRDGAWKIAFRCTVIEWSSTVPGNTVPLFENLPDLHLNGLSVRGKEDISYRRPFTNCRRMNTPADIRALSAPRR